MGTESCITTLIELYEGRTLKDKSASSQPDSLNASLSSAILPTPDIAAIPVNETSCTEEAGK